MFHNWRYNILVAFALFSVIAYFVAKNEHLNAVSRGFMVQVYNSTTGEVLSNPTINNFYTINNTSVININNTTINIYNTTVINIINNNTTTSTTTTTEPLLQLPKIPTPCGHSSMLVCLFNENKEECVWCPSTQTCMNKSNYDENTRSCPHWCGSQLAYSDDGLGPGVGTFNQVQLYIDMFLLARAYHMVYVPLPLFTTRYDTTADGKQFPAAYAFDYEYMNSYLTNYTCIVSRMPTLNATQLRHGGARTNAAQVITWSTNTAQHRAAYEQYLSFDYISLSHWMFQYIIDSRDDNDMVMQYWKYFKTNRTLETVAEQVMKEIDLKTGEFLAVHLRVEADWTKPPYSRTFPLPADLIKELQKHKTSGDVYIAVGEPLTSSKVAPYVSALQAASYTVKVKPPIGKYFPECAACFDLASLVDFNVLLAAHTCFGVQLSTFFQGVYNTRRMRDQQAVILERVVDAEIWSGYIPWEWDQSFVDQRRNEKLNVLGKPHP